MANDYFQKGSAINPYTTAKAEDVNDELSKIEAGFDKLPTPRDDGTGFKDPVKVADAVEAEHAISKGQFDAVVSDVFTARDQAQASQVAAAASEASADADAAQTASDRVQVATNTANVDAKHTDVVVKHSDVVTKHNEVVPKHADVVEKHAEVVSNHADVTSKHSEVVQVATDFNKLNLGAHAVEPTTDNNGDPLTDGAWYYNTTTHLSYVRTQGVFAVTNLSSYTTVFQDSPNGAMELPFGADSGRPAGQEKPWLRARLSDGKAEYFNPVTKKIGPVGGGGVPVPITVTDQVYVAGKDENIRVDVSDDVSRTVTIEPGWNVGDFIYASLGGWTGNPSVTVTLDPDDSYSWDYADIPDGEPFVIEGNQFVAIQVVAANSLSVSFAKGEYDDVDPLDTSWKIIGVDANTGSLGTEVTSNNPDDALPRMRYLDESTVQVMGIFRLNAPTSTNTIEIWHAPTEIASNAIEGRQYNPASCNDYGSSYTPYTFFDNAAGSLSAARNNSTGTFVVVNHTIALKG